jgi:hypothetical protein
MAKRKTVAKRSANRLPKGLPVPGSTLNSSNPFESADRLQKRAKHDVVNRGGHAKPLQPSALVRALEQRRDMMRARLQASI